MIANRANDGSSPPQSICRSPRSRASGCRRPGVRRPEASCSIGGTSRRSASSSRPASLAGPPPALTSWQYTKDFLEVKIVGELEQPRASAGPGGRGAILRRGPARACVRPGTRAGGRGGGLVAVRGMPGRSRCSTWRSSTRCSRHGHQVRLCLLAANHRDPGGDSDDNPRTGARRGLDAASSRRPVSRAIRRPTPRPAMLGGGLPSGSSAASASVHDRTLSHPAIPDVTLHLYPVLADRRPTSTMRGFTAEFTSAPTRMPVRFRAGASPTKSTGRSCDAALVHSARAFNDGRRDYRENCDQRIRRFQ